GSLELDAGGDPGADPAQFAIGEDLVLQGVEREAGRRIELRAPPDTRLTEVADSALLRGTGWRYRTEAPRQGVPLSLRAQGVVSNSFLPAAPAEGSQAPAVPAEGAQLPDGPAGGSRPPATQDGGPRPAGTPAPGPEAP